jgi:hypothetical protein
VHREPPHQLRQISPNWYISGKPDVSADLATLAYTAFRPVGTLLALTERDRSASFKAVWEEQMKVIENGNDSTGFERFSRRLQNGVEILEHETVHTIKVEDGTFKMKRPTRLVVSDAFTRSKNFIAKSRSQMGDIDAFLKSIIRHPIESK